MSGMSGVTCDDKNYRMRFGTIWTIVDNFGRPGNITDDRKYSGRSERTGND